VWRKETWTTTGKTRRRTARTSLEAKKRVEEETTSKQYCHSDRRKESCVKTNVIIKRQLIANK
jgi:hypothetical protein